MPKSAARRLAAAVLFLSLSSVGAPVAHGAAGDDLPLEVVWPPKGVRVDGLRIRVGGHTDPSATITVNGRPLRVFASGAFAGTCPLEIGENVITCRAAKNGQTKTVARSVIRNRPLRTLPRSPVRFDPAWSGEPSEDLEVRAGDTIRIRVKGSPGARATFRIGSGKTHYPLSEITNGSVGGFYAGSYTIKPTDRFVQARITCYLSKKASSGGSRVRHLLPTHVTVNTQPFPGVARVEEDYTQIRAEPSGGAPLAMARADTYLSVVGRSGDRVRVALTDSLHGWLPHDQIEPAPAEPPAQRGTIRNLSITEDRDATILRIPLGLRVPFAVTERGEQPTLELTIFGVENRLNWITDRTGNGLAETISAVPSDDGAARFLVSLRGNGLLGFRGYYEGDDFLFALRPLPSGGDPARPLSGRTIILDPGHGGTSRGTIGSTGLEEKAINLDLSRILKARLESRGAKVVLTRENDVDVSLADRTRLAESVKDATLFVSIHNNSISLTDDPLAARGVGVFYFHPHSRDAAHTIYRRMLGVEPAPRPYGVIQGDFFVCREVTVMPSVLLECVFLSSPEDEMLLLDKAFAARYMEAVASGISDWCGSVAGKPASMATMSGK